MLYVDEVNLLHDHLVDVLLDAAAMGRVHIERDGVSHSHEARFVLVGTMNPEEGELRPQLLDRFGLTVDVRASRDVDERAEVIRQRMAFEADPCRVRRRYAEHDAALAQRIATARGLVADVVLPDNELRRIAALCAAFDVDGMRADLVVARTAVAHAAWRGADVVDEEDIRVAAELALPHRRRRDPFDEPDLDPQKLDEALAQAVDDRMREESLTPTRTRARPAGRGSVEFRRAATSFAVAVRPGPARLRLRRSAPGCSRCPVSARARRAGARAPATAPVPWCPLMPPSGFGVHLFGTVLAAARRARTRGSASRRTRRRAPRDPRRPRGQSGDLRRRRVGLDGRARPDVGGQRRDAVAAARCLPAPRQGRGDHLPRRGRPRCCCRRRRRCTSRRAGWPGSTPAGKTPLAQGLLAARDMVARERVRDPARRSLVVVLTDGRATGGPDPVGTAGRAADLLVAEGASAVVVDCETSWVRLGLAEQLAGRLGAPTVRLAQLRADGLTEVVRGAA